MTKPSKPQTVMGFDFGMKNIGVAIGQSLTKTATPEATLKAKDGIPNWEEIQKLIKEWQPAALVVGLPLNMDGSISESSQRAKKFANRLQDKSNLPTHIFNEQLSTHEAKELAETSASIYGWERHSIDSIAAALILKNWLDENF